MTKIIIIIIIIIILIIIIIIIIIIIYFNLSINVNSYKKSKYLNTVLNPLLLYLERNNSKNMLMQFTSCIVILKQLRPEQDRVWERSSNFGNFRKIIQIDYFEDYRKSR